MVFMMYFFFNLDQSNSETGNMVPLQSVDSSFESILGGKRLKNKKKKEEKTLSFNIDLVPYTEELPAEYNWRLMVEHSETDGITRDPQGFQRKR